MRFSCFIHCFGIALPKRRLKLAASFWGLKLQTEHHIKTILNSRGVDIFSALPRQNQSEMADLFAGAGVGLALFDANLVLLASNDLYRSLCGYLGTDMPDGTDLQALVRLTFKRLNTPNAEIDDKIAKILDRLQPGTAYTFRYTTPSGSPVEVCRRR